MGFFMIYLRFVIFSAAWLGIGALLMYAHLKEDNRLCPKRKEDVSE